MSLPENIRDREYQKFVIDSDGDTSIRSVSSGFLDTDGNISAFKSVDGKPRYSSMPYLYDVAEGNVTGHSGFYKYGRVTNVNTVTVDVWSVGGLYAFPTTGAQLQLVSTSVEDDVGKGGINAVDVEYLDYSYVPHTETVILDGLTPVTTTARDIYRINRLYAHTVSTGAGAGGNIDIRKLTGSPIYGRIDAGLTQSRQLIYTVPSGSNLFITSIRFSSGIGGTSVKTEFCTFTTKATVDPGTGIVANSFYPFNEIGVINNTSYVPLEIPTKIPAKSDLKISVYGDSAQGANCNAAIRGWLENV